MDIRAAIFDCDGTLLDSMPMWNRVFPDWLRSHGIADARALADKYEYMNFEDECFFFHDEYGVCESRQAALDEVRERVAWEYAHTVRPFPGVRAFLDELVAADIPLAIGSSTSVPLLRQALGAHGLLGYFRAILYTGDVGADKQHPDIYLAARDALGASTETTWVFEDAPFGAKTARDAGFPVVALLNDHDGRDEGFMAAHSDILAHGYPELSLALLRDYERPLAGEARGTLGVLVVGGSPERSSAELVARLAGEADYVIACDRGAEMLHAAGIAPDAFCGDDDTVSPAVGAWAHEAARTWIHYPAEKYVTDLDLALGCAQHEAARRRARLSLTFTCTSGGRVDHELAVMGKLASVADASPRVVEDLHGRQTECRILAPAGSARWELGAQAQGARLSAIALAPGTVVSERGMRWDLDHADLPLLSDQGISNVVASPDAAVTCHAGVLACFVG